MGTPVFDPDRNGGVEFDFGGTAVLDAHPYGNRFDTWHPDAKLVDDGVVATATGGTINVDVVRPFPPPYRPLKNPLGGDVGVPVRGPGGALLNTTADGLSLLGPDLSLTRSPFGAAAGSGDVGAVRSDRTGRVTTKVLDDAVGVNNESTPVLDAPGDVGDDDAGTYRGPDDDDNAGSGDDEQYGDYAVTAVAAQGLGNQRLFPDPNEVGRLGSDDEKPLRAVRITVRFYDVGSERMREVSFRHGLLD